MIIFSRTYSQTQVFHEFIKEQHKQANMMHLVWLYIFQDNT